MYKTIAIVLTLASATLTAEISRSYASSEKQSSFNPDLQPSEPVTHPVTKKEAKDQEGGYEAHPVFKAEDHARVRMELVKADGNVVKHDMLADQPNNQGHGDVNRIDTLQIPNYAYAAPVEVNYPDVPYAPAYGYENNYGGPNGYEPYGTGLTSYFLEPDTSALSYLWNQVPDARAIVGFVGRTVAWLINSMVVVLVGSMMTIAVCSYSNICSIQFHGLGPIHEEMRAFMNPDRLEKISNAADFVKTAIDKYQKIQNTNVKPSHRQGI